MKNIVYVEFSNSRKRYLYEVPANVNITKGQRLLINDTGGKVQAVTNSCKVDSGVLSVMCEELGIDELKKAVGIIFDWEEN